MCSSGIFHSSHRNNRTLPTTTTIEPTTVTEPNTTVAPVPEVVTMETQITNGTADNSTIDTIPENPPEVVPSNEQTNIDENNGNQGNKGGSDVTGSDVVEKFGVPLTETTSTTMEPPPIYSDNDSGIKIVENFSWPWECRTSCNFIPYVFILLFVFIFE